MKKTRELLILLLFGSTTCMAALGAEDSMVRIPRSKYEVLEKESGIKVRVEISPFLMASRETTQAEYLRVTGHNPSSYQDPQKPVETVGWWDALRYCNLRSLQEGLEPCYDLETGRCDFSRNGYRLPTEAEWAAACGPLPSDEAGLRTMGRLGNDNTKSIDGLMVGVEQGTARTGSFRPNALGLFDMVGNVWEWCFDAGNPVPDPASLFDPVETGASAEKVLRGGSFVTMLDNWNKGFRSSLRPDSRSRYTGFRVCRSLPEERKSEVPPADDAFLNQFDQAPAGFKGQTGNLSSPLLRPNGGKAASWAEWMAMRPGLLKKWEEILGLPETAPPPPAVKTIRTFSGHGYQAEMMYLQVEPDYWEKVLLMTPDRPARRPAPAIIVPYYDVDAPAGENLGGRVYSPKGTRSFAYMLVRQGYVVLSVRWWGEAYGENYNEAVANLRLRHPALTGHGKWVWDARRAVDYLVTLPQVDPKRIGMIGHSLGAKMTLYASALDERIAAAVFSEGGIGFSFSNYDDYWYFGEKLHTLDPKTDQHELLALMAPRPFLIIGGDDADNDRSWYYVNSGREVYSLKVDPRRIGYFNHRTGHSPTPESISLAMDWFKRFLEGD